MKLIEQTGTDLGLSGTEFTLKASAKAFHILSSSLYSDKILAVVRELSCNAWDSHISAEKTNTAFDVCLPTSKSNTFFIRDYGLGLSPDSIEKIYTTYFESTKTESNDVTGALGLGSKSPFCLSNEFTVESYYEGTHYTYVAYIGPNGMPTLSFVSDVETKEPNGVKITLDKQWSWSEVSEFQSAAAKVYKWFPLLPNISGQTVTISETKLIERLSDTISIVNGTNYSRPITIKQGTVAYTVRSRDMNNAGVTTIPDKEFLIEVPIGSVDVTAGREDISFVKTTVDTLTQIGLDIQQIMKNKCLDQFKNAGTNVWKLSDLYQELITRYTKAIATDALEEYCDLKTISTDDIQNLYLEHRFAGVAITTYTSHSTIISKNSYSYNFEEVINVTPAQTIIFVNNQNKGYTNRLRKLRQTMSNRILVIDFVNRKQYNQVIVDEMLKQLQNPIDAYLVYSANVNLDSRAPRLPKEEQQLTVTTITADKIEYDPTTMKDAYFADMEHSSSRLFGEMYKPEGVSEFVDHIIRVTGKRVNIYSVNKTQRKLFNKKGIKLKSVDSVLRDTFKNYDFAPVMAEYDRSIIREPFVLPRPEYRHEFVENCRVPHIVEYVNTVPDDTYSLNNKIYAIRSLANLDSHIAVFAKFKEWDSSRGGKNVISLATEVKEKCPLVIYFDSWAIRKESYAKDLANYINTCYGV